MDTCHDAKCISKCLVNIKMVLGNQGEGPKNHGVNKIG